MIFTMLIAIGTTLLGATEDDQKKRRDGITKTFKEISIIIFSAMFALWLTGLDEEIRSKKQLISYYSIEKEYCQEKISGVYSAYKLFAEEEGTGAKPVPPFLPASVRLQNTIDALLLNSGFDQNSINYSDIAITYSNSAILTRTNSYVNDLQDELNRLKRAYLEDGEITPRVYYEMYHVAINAHAACQGFDRQIRWLEGHTVSEKWGIQADYYEDDGKEMYYIDQCFISHFDGADGNWWSHAYFNDVYGKDAEDVTWEDVLLEREES